MLIFSCMSLCFRLYALLPRAYQLRSRVGYTSLHAAVISGNEAVVQLVMKHPQADPRAYNNLGVTPLHLGAIRGFDQVVRTMLDLKADMRTEVREETLLDDIHACRMNIPPCAIAWNPYQSLHALLVDERRGGRWSDTVLLECAKGSFGDDESVRQVWYVCMCDSCVQCAFRVEE